MTTRLPDALVFNLASLEPYGRLYEDGSRWVNQLATASYACTRANKPHPCRHIPVESEEEWDWKGPQCLNQIERGDLYLLARVEMRAYCISIACALDMGILVFPTDAAPPPPVVPIRTVFDGVWELMDPLGERWWLWKYAEGEKPWVLCTTPGPMGITIPSWTFATRAEALAHVGMDS